MSVFVYVDVISAVHLEFCRLCIGVVAREANRMCCSEMIHSDSHIHRSPEILIIVRVGVEEIKFIPLALLVLDHQVGSHVQHQGRDALEEFRAGGFLNTGQIDAMRLPVRGLELSLIAVCAWGRSYLVASCILVYGHII